MLRGGAVIGQGTYGCAVSPPLLCRGQARNDRRAKQVGKITLKMDAAVELQIAEILRKAPLWKNYYVLPELTHCEPIPSGSANWGTCKITKTEEPEALKQVISDFGGRSFSSLSGKNLRPGSFDYFEFFEHLLEACAYLVLQGVVHYDLHRSNILIDPLGVPRLLDFGMSFSAQDINKNTIGTRWKVYDPKYDSEPPEVTIITGLRDKLSLATAIDECIYGKPVFSVAEDILEVSKATAKSQLQKFTERSASFQKQDWVAFWATYWTGFDAFAVGAVLLNVLKVQITLPQFTGDPRWIEKGDRIMEILTKMITPDPSERYDCVEALFLWDPKNALLRNNGAAWLETRRGQRLQSS
jgi:serine/threonine protein kinase